MLSLCKISQLLLAVLYLLYKHLLVTQLLSVRDHCSQWTPFSDKPRKQDLFRQANLLVCMHAGTMSLEFDSGT